jgi:uncharacterized protein
MTYLITGATGFIGRHLVEFLLARGDTVNYLGRHRGKTMDSRAAFHCWNPGEMPPLSSVPRVDAIIHLAGEPVAQRWNAEVKRRIHSSRVEATRQLVSAVSALQHKPAAFVSASATGYYGDRGEEILTEYSPPGTGFLAEVSTEWEREASRASDAGLRVVVVRIGAVLGRHGGALKRMLTPFRLGLGGTFGNGRQWMPWIHIQDLIQLLVFAADNRSVCGTLNGCSPEPIRNAQFTAAAARALHRPAFLRIPKFALRLALGEIADFIFQSSRVVPKMTMQAGFHFKYPQIDKAFTDLL